MNLSRRELFGISAGLLGAGALGTGIARASGWTALDDAPVAAGKKPKNIIFCVVDGMPLSCLTIVDHLRKIREGKSSYWAWLLEQPFVVNGLQDTRSLNSVVTDSSAASSAWGCGSHIWNGMTNMLPDKTSLTTLTTLMHGKGMRSGLVTTATITHATPSGFAVSCVNRDLEALIAEKYLPSGVDVLLGGGDRFFAADKRTDKRDLYADFAKAGYAVMKDRDSLMKAQRKGKMLGIFSTSHLPYTVDRNNDPKFQAAVPTLTEMTNVALENLNRDNKRGFLLQVEGARVDHGGHSNDLAAMVHDQIEFENAVRACIEFAMKDKNTLVIITADHACGGLAMNGMGEEYIDTSLKGIPALNRIKSSYGPMLAAIGATRTVERVKDVSQEKLGFAFSDDEAQMVVDTLNGKHPFGGSSFFRSPQATLGMLIGNHTACTFTSGNHHSDHVMVTAYGPGAELCSGMTQNIDFFGIMTSLKGISHKNPSMTFEQAAPLYEKLKTDGAEELAELSVLYGAHEDCGCHGG